MSESDFNIIQIQMESHENSWFTPPLLNTLSNIVPKPDSQFGPSIIKHPLKSPFVVENGYWKNYVARHFAYEEHLLVKNYLTYTISSFWVPVVIFLSSHTRSSILEIKLRNVFFITDTIYSHAQYTFQNKKKLADIQDTVPFSIHPLKRARPKL